jgi:sec-independent protein translocase protein TatB
MLSLPHLIIIFVVALVVFGPEKLPELARNLGKVLGEFRRATGDIRSTFEDHLRDLERESEQRRIGAAAPAATNPAVTAAPATTPDAPVVTPAQGIVPTFPQQNAIGTPRLAEENPAEASASGTPNFEPTVGYEPAAAQPSKEKEH